MARGLSLLFYLSNFWYIFSPIQYVGLQGLQPKFLVRQTVNHYVFSSAEQGRKRQRTSGLLIAKDRLLWAHIWKLVAFGIGVLTRWWAEHCRWWGHSKHPEPTRSSYMLYCNPWIGGSDKYIKNEMHEIKNASQDAVGPTLDARTGRDVNCAGRSRRRTRCHCQREWVNPTCQGGSAFIIAKRAERVPTYSIGTISCANVFYVFVSSSAGTCARRMLPEVVQFSWNYRWPKCRKSLGTAPKWIDNR